jgi:hypothetical protein
LAGEIEKLKQLIHDQKEEIKYMKTEEYHSKKEFTQQIN